ncbi:WD40 repeat-like protein [Cryphonectria parasitica EP155]|uniref:Probable cytosolic iron-sulfur protein assembly protein 1 n=1 Tax=Cryphonectria parasitica (strain ATCC 38755 / EP155) TaxID=660469 RepID=A0A9P4Y2T6_CRYP1|nr:WD40 repeat-like protein [Cryphonectria parasitica EP155]KAF3765939.1 WD40 repeat-like protein [Cryphonectria parasitica EP155]
MAIVNARTGRSVRLEALPPFKPELNQRAWASIPHPTLPLLATCHAKAVTVYSLSTLSSHSTLAGGHARSVRTAAWKPALPPHKLCLVTASFDSTAALWRWDGDNIPFSGAEDAAGGGLEVEIKRANGISSRSQTTAAADNSSDKSDDDEDWEYTLVLEGHESEVKSAAFSPAGQFLATCSRDKSVWIWEDVGSTEAEDEWETVAVLSEHDGDVKCVAWCPDVPGRTGRGNYGSDVLATSSYDDTVRVWREDGDGEWVCVAVLEGHDGTVWGVQWEANPDRKRFPRLMTFSADRTIRVWTLKEDDETGMEGDGRNPMFRSGLGGIPNTMRASLREEWKCTAILPAAHTRDVYSASWSASTGLVASTGSDGVIAIYREEEEEQEEEEPQPGENGHLPTGLPNGSEQSETLGSEVAMDGPAGSRNWKLLTTVKNSHGPHEVNHITWCRRFDPGSDARGIEEMLITTGDNGVVKPWKVITT